MRQTEKDTRQKLLEAAAQVFGQQGFRAATVRKICRKAGANVAAVNYYYGGKQMLYLAVIEDLFSAGFKAHPPDRDFDPDAPAEEKLRVFVRNFFLRLADQDGWMGGEGGRKLVLRELADPSPALDHIINTYLRPHKEMLAAIVAEMLGPASGTPENIIRCCLSIVGQCFHYAVGRPIITRVMTEIDDEMLAADRTAEHIARFSAGGIRHIKAAAIREQQERRGLGLKESINDGIEE